MSEINNTQWVDVNYIQQHYLPISKKLSVKCSRKILTLLGLGRNFWLNVSNLKTSLETIFKKCPLSQQNVIRGINCNILFSSYYTIIDSMVTILIQTY